jgi:carbon starvation protein
MLAAIALCVGTTIIIKSGRLRYVWVTALPLAWLVTVTTSAALEKLFSLEPRIGFLAHANQLAQHLAAGALSSEMAAQAPQLIFNDRLDALLTALFLIITWVLVFDTLRVCYNMVSGRRFLPLSETPYVPTQLLQER